ncbi:MAG: DUF1858 domain-containing protein [Nitrospinae bacterium]|nr:DUF1858 domain-containing protein [Nitrospinota bacterium]
MEKYPKLFVKVSIFYLLFGIVFGLLIATNVVSGLNYTFVHVHFNLIGFMSMMLFGVAYHILPRFNAQPLKWPKLVPIHFYGVNIGLIGMLFAYLIGGFWSSDWKTILFHIFSTVTAVSIMLFIVNIYTVLTPPAPVPQPKTEEKAKEPVKETPAPVTAQKEVITAEMKVSDVLEKWPHLLAVFVESGFAALANPTARATFARMITIKQACKVHNLGLDNFIQKINDSLNGKGGRTAPLPKATPTPPAKPMQKGPVIKRGDKCSKEIMIGDLIGVYPETKKIFEKHYGAGCFSCPGQATETVAQTAMMHNISADSIVKEINDEIEKALAGTKT